jgi:hypothetical protein
VHLGLAPTTTSPLLLLILPPAAPRSFSLSSAMLNPPPLPPSFKKRTQLSGRPFVLPSKFRLFGTLRRALTGFCSASKSNQLCVTETLSSVEAVTGPLTISKLVEIVPEIATGQNSTLSSVNFCTPCVKQMYNIAKADFPTFGQGTIASDVQATCGASFVGQSTVDLD